MPLLDTKYSDDDWDYSVPVHHRDESLALDDLQLFEEELYDKDNSLVVDEAPPPRFVRQPHEPETKCTSCLGGETPKKERPESLFYQTYQTLQPPATTRTTSTTTIPTTNCLVDMNTSLTTFWGSSSPRLLLDKHDSNHGGRIAAPKQKIPTNTTDTIDPIVFMTTPHVSPNVLFKMNTNNNNNKKNSRHQKKKTTHLHVSSIPPPSCSFNLLSSHDYDCGTKKSTNTATPIVDIFADLNSLSSQLDQTRNDDEESFSVATSIVSTTLGSMDTPQHAYGDREDYRDEHVYASSASNSSQEEEEEYPSTSTIIRGVPSVEYSNDKESNNAEEQECKDTDDWYTHRHLHTCDNKTKECKRADQMEPVVDTWFPRIVV